MRLAAHGMLMLAALIWGTTFVFQTTGMETMGPFGFTWARFMIGAVALLPFALIEARRVRLDRIVREAAPGWVLPVGIFGLGASMAVGSLLQQIALGHTSVANAAFLTALYVPLVPVLGLLFLRRNIRLLRWGAVAVFVPGSALLTGASPSGAAYGDFAVAVGALFWAGHILLVGWLVRLTRAPIQLALAQTAITAAIALPPMLLLETVDLAAVVPALPELLYAGVLSTALGFGMQLVAQRHASNTASAILLSLESVFAAIAGWAMLGQSMAGVAILGAGFIFVAVLIIELTPDERARQP